MKVHLQKVKQAEALADRMGTMPEEEYDECMKSMADAEEESPPALKVEAVKRRVKKLRSAGQYGALLKVAAPWRTVTAVGGDEQADGMH